MSFVAAATAIGLEGVAANIAAGAMMGGSVKVGTNVLTGQDPFKDIGRGIVMGGLTGGLTPGVSEALGVGMPMAAGITQGGLTALATGDITKGLMAGVGAYGMYGLTGAGQQAGLDQAMSGVDVPGGEQVFGDSQTEIGDGSAGSKFNKYLTNPTATGAAAQANSTGNFFKDNWKYAAAAAAPILADQAVKSNLPTTTTRPGEVHTFSYNPYNQYYTPTGNYEVPIKKAAGGGLMGMNSNGYNPGELNFSGGGDPIVRMAKGGVPGYAIGGAPGGGITGGVGLDMNNDIYKYFSDPATQALLKSGNDAAIAAKMQEKDWTAAQIAAATGTQNLQSDYEKRFVNAVATPGITADQFNAYTADVGLTGQNLNTALQNSGLSQSAQYALTHKLDDAAGISTAPAAAQNFYNTIGYTAGALPGDQGGLAGVYANINYSAKGLQDQINAGKLTVDQAQVLARGEMNRVGVNEKDIKNATGVDFANLFKPKVTTQNPIVCGPGYRLNAAGTACEPIGVTEIFNPPTAPSGYHYENGVLVKNIDATQNTSTDVTTPTNLYTAPSTALPVGISGNTGPSQIGGGATVNPNGTITSSPRIPNIPVGGFTSMEQVRDTYEKGGGSLGVNKNLFAPKTQDELYSRYKMTGGSKAAFDYLTGKTKYSALPVTETGEIMKPYAESVLGVPMNKSSKQYLYDPDTRKYTLNPDFIPISYTSEGQKVYGLSSKDIVAQLPDVPKSDYEKWMKDNNVTLAQIAQALNISLAEAKKRYPSAGGTSETAKTDIASGKSITVTDNQGNAEQATIREDGLYYTSGGNKYDEKGVQVAATGGLAALTMARGGTTHMPFFSKSTGKFTSRGPQVYAGGGMSDQYDLGSYSDGGRLLRGPGDGVSDSIPATIGNKRPARLADGEFVVPARIVSELGNGSTEAGARKLYAMMERVQSARKGSIGKGKVANNSRADKYLPA
jgi:hypothetical protein